MRAEREMKVSNVNESFQDLDTSIAALKDKFIEINYPFDSCLVSMIRKRILTSESSSSEALGSKSK